MSLSIMKRTAPLSLLCCGVKNGGGVSASAPLQNFPKKREDELDGYMEEADGRTVKSGMNELELPVESHVQLQDRDTPKLTRPGLEMETRELLCQFYRSYTGLPVPYRNKRHSALPSLQRVVENVLFKHRITYNGMVQRLLEQANGLNSVRSVLSRVFSDGVISWGRIASVLALGAVVCEQLKQDCDKERAEERVDIVASHISSYIGTDLQHWFINNNGWNGFVEFFRVEDAESTVRNTLMAMAGLGIGACLFTLMR